MKAFIVLCFIAVASAQWQRPGGRRDPERPQVQEPRCTSKTTAEGHTIHLNDPNNANGYLQCVDQGWAGPHNCPPGLTFNVNWLNEDGTVTACTWPGQIQPGRVLPPQFPNLRPFAEDAPAEETE